MYDLILGFDSYRKSRSLRSKIFYLSIILVEFCTLVNFLMYFGLCYKSYSNFYYLELILYLSLKVPFQISSAGLLTLDLLLYAYLLRKVICIKSYQDLKVELERDLFCTFIRLYFQLTRITSLGSIRYVYDKEFYFIISKNVTFKDFKTLNVLVAPFDKNKLFIFLTDQVDMLFKLTSYFFKQNAYLYYFFKSSSEITPGCFGFVTSEDFYKYYKVLIELPLIWFILSFIGWIYQTITTFFRICFTMINMMYILSSKKVKKDFSS